MPDSYEQPTLASVEDLTKRFPVLCKDVEPFILQQILEEATQNIEDRVGRRLAPFTNHVFQDHLIGIDPDELGSGDFLPMSWSSSLAMSYADALGAGSNVRHFWLDQFAPSRPDLWTYSVSSITIYHTYGDSMPIDIDNGGILGPDETDGHIWLRLGTFAPQGSRVQVIYSGGYTVAIPPSLRRACTFQAAKFLMLEAEPARRGNMNLEEIDMQISMLLAPWVRG